MYCINSSVLWHVVGSPLLLYFCIILCCISYSHVWQSSSMSWLGANILKSLFLWWLSMDDVGLQVRHLVREATVNICRFFQVVPCDLWQPQGFADICEVGLSSGWQRIFLHCLTQGCLQSDPDTPHLMREAWTLTGAVLLWTRIPSIPCRCLDSLPLKSSAPNYRITAGS